MAASISNINGTEHFSGFNKPDPKTIMAGKATAYSAEFADKEVGETTTIATTEHEYITGPRLYLITAS